MTMFATVRQMRIDKILELLQEPHTMKELAEATGANYYTIRKDIEDLLSAGKVMQNGNLRGKAILFIAGQKRPMPVLRNQYNGQQIALPWLANAWIENHTQGSVVAQQKVPEYIIHILHMAKQARNGQAVNAKELQELRKATTQAHLLVSSFSNLLGQILAAEVLWNPKTLPNIYDDPTFPTDEIDKWYTEVLRRNQNEA